MFLNDIYLPLPDKKWGVYLPVSLTIYLFRILNSKFGYLKSQFGLVMFLLLSYLSVSETVKENPLFFNIFQRKAQWNLLNKGWQESGYLLIDIQFPNMPTFAQDCTCLRNDVQTEKPAPAHATILIETVS